eukprot:4795628-Pyramimonas_sp.AAC.1
MWHRDREADRDQDNVESAVFHDESQEDVFWFQAKDIWLVQARVALRGARSPPEEKSPSDFSAAVERVAVNCLPAEEGSAIRLPVVRGSAGPPCRA